MSCLNRLLNKCTDRYFDKWNGKDNVLGQYTIKPQFGDGSYLFHIYKAFNQNEKHIATITVITNSHIVLGDYHCTKKELKHIKESLNSFYPEFKIFMEGEDDEEMY